MNLSDIDNLRKTFKVDLNQGGDKEGIRVKYLGRKKGLFTLLKKELPNLSVEEKRKIGPALSKLRTELEKGIKTLKISSKKEKLIEAENKDLEGHLNPLTHMQREIEDAFIGLGFSVIEGKQLETEYYNFDALNIPPDHPARDMWDTFWVKQRRNGERLCMRTHTSPMQIRYMQTHKPPFQIIVPGRCFRYEATDSTHESNLHQFEALMVGEDISIANFKYIIRSALRTIFERDLEVRFRPSYFPFTEPSFEIDVKFRGRSSGWLELAGAGMVHPKVFEEVGYDPKKVTGAAFGMGIGRLAMVKYGIPDVRLIKSGDLRVMKQF